jgi:acyl-CoA reductase-like NAD-dependent aldehyde dehydrogenase
MAPPDRFQVLSPVDGEVVTERALATPAELDGAIAAGHRARASWRATPLDERIAVLRALVDAFVAEGDAIADELTAQMGRPRRFSPGEVSGLADRANTMLDLAPAALADVVPPPKQGFRRLVRREPLGLVLVLAPWNYPYLTAVNAVIPALAAGNTVLLKHSDQTPLCAERMVAAGRAAGLPPGVFEYIHMSHDLTAAAVRDQRVDHVAFTGSVGGGHAVVAAASQRFVGVGLELGGKDPAYVRADADLAFAAENVVEGALFNSGQSCCAVERVYVHEAVWDDFIEKAVSAAESWHLGLPTDPETTLGPVVRPRNARDIRAHVNAALAAGAWGLVDPNQFGDFGSLGEGFVAPQLLVEVTHEMDIMREETFGPVAGIMKVSSDAEAIRLMNDSRFGLTASVWTRDAEAAMQIGGQLETGTVFMNRCDYLDPMLAWTGVKDSGRGCTLSSLGFEHLTRPRSYHLRLRD